MPRPDKHLFPLPEFWLKFAKVGEDAGRARTLQIAALPRSEARQVPAAATLAALGIVYGDIGPRPLYGFKQAACASGAITPETIIGSVSVILWSLIVIAAFKYAILIMRADNRGEGGIVALLALLDVRRAPAGSWRASLLIVGLVGAALLYGDGVITPAISVLSAVEGLKLDAPQLAPAVVPISIAILIGLFLVQRKGTAFIGNIFGPVMLIWFIAIGLLGLGGIIGGRHRLGGDPGGVAAGLRGAAWQHRGQHHLARLPGTDRAAVRQGEAHLVDGPRHPDRGG